MVGAESLPEVFYEALKTFSRREFHRFKTREEAMDWLVREDGGEEMSSDDRTSLGRLGNASWARQRGAAWMLLRVQTEVTGDVFILRCDGRIVFGDEGAVLRDRVINLLSGTPKIVVNLNGVDYIDSGGFGVLVGLFISAKKRGGDLKLVSPNERVTEVLRHTNLDTIFKVYGKDDEAVAAFRKQVAWGHLLG
jgi:anti-sigma B factor antagonist